MIGSGGNSLPQTLQVSCLYLCGVTSHLFISLYLQLFNLILHALHHANLSRTTCHCSLPLHGLLPHGICSIGSLQLQILCTLLPPICSSRRPCCAGAVQVMAECIDAVLRIADSGGHVAPALMQVCSIVKVRRARRPRPDAGTRARDGARTDAALLQYSHALCGACRPCHIWASLIGGLPSLYSPPFRGITCHILIWALLSLAPPSGDPASDML